MVGKGNAEAIVCAACGKESLAGAYCDQCGKPFKTQGRVQEKPSTRAVETSGGSSRVSGANVHSDLLNNRYQLLHEVGEGGMGVVYKAQDIRLNRAVAVKRMREELKMDLKAKRRFLEEAERVAKLVHPRIVTIHEWFEEDSEVYLVFEFVEGKSLKEIIAHEGKLKPEDSVEFMYQICDAISYAHAENILHRDLKPSNVMVTHGKHVKVMDFGVAREIKNTVASTSGKETTGTIAYMAPEQELGRPEKRSDVYSLGACLYEMVTGELPFEGPNFLIQKERMMFKPMGETAKDVPEKLEAIVAKCLQAEPSNRFKNVDELIKALEA